MSVTAAELIWYAALDPSTTDGTTVGGGIDTTTIVVPTSSSLFNALSGGSVNIVSSSSSDTSQTCTIYGRNAAGSIISETLNLNGTTTVDGSNAYNRLERVQLSATTVGTITVVANTGGTVIVTLTPGVKQMLRPFYNVSADVSSGSQRIYYEKLFAKNTDGTNSLLSAQIIKEADPTGDFTFWVVTSGVNDTGTATNRQTAPSGSSFSSTTQGTATTDLAAGAAQGVWWALTLAAGTAATTTTFTPRISGSTT